MFYQIAALTIMIVFYGFYLAKLILQKKQSIKTNQMGIGNKPKKVLIIERVMRVGIPEEKTSLVMAGIYQWSRKKNICRKCLERSTQNIRNVHGDIWGENRVEKR